MSKNKQKNIKAEGEGEGKSWTGEIIMKVEYKTIGLRKILFFKIHIHNRQNT